MSVRIACLLTLALALAASVLGADVYVSPSGADSAAGTKDQPLATPQAARDAARRLVAAGEAVAVHLADGVYVLDKPLMLGKEDSGAAGKPIVWRAQNAGKAALLGGKEIPPAAFKPPTDADAARIPAEARGKVLVADLAAMGIGPFADPPKAYRASSGQPELFFDDQPMAVAAWPNGGEWVTIDKVLDRDGVFTANEDRMTRWDLAAGVWLHGYWCHDWSDETIRVQSLDPAEKKITLAAKHNYGVGASAGWNKVPRRYRALNVLAELDAPGEWYLDRQAARVFFYPPAPVAGKRIVMSLVRDPLVQLKDASHVRLRGLMVEGTLGDGVSITGGTDCRVEGCTIRNIAGSGVVVRGGTAHAVASSDLYNLGCSGIQLSGGDRKTLSPGGHAAHNNHVRHFGRLQRTYAAAVHLNGVGNRMTNCLAHDAPHAAVLYGGNEHVIEANEIHHVALETSDVGAFYTGRDWTSRGNVVRGNFFHDLVSKPGVGTMGVYLDDCDSGDSIVGNVFLRAGRAMFIGGGRDNLVENNLFIDCEQALHIDSRGLKQITNGQGGSWDLLAKAKAVNYDQPPWSVKYPRLARIMQDKWQLPEGNVIRRNIALGCKQWLHESGMKDHMDIVTFESNVTDGAAPEGVTAESLRRALPLTPEILAKVPGWRPIAIGRMGLVADEFRKSLSEPRP
jgi:hypothetical protein